MTKTLVTYYSWSGNTEKVARAIAAALSADVDEIREIKPRTELFAYVRAAIEVSRRKATPIAAAETDAGKYDVVILGSPVRAGEMAPALRAYIEREKHKFKNVAHEHRLFFLSLHSHGEARC